MQPNDENMYSKWLNNELSDAELKDLEASNELPILEKIIAEVDTWELPPVTSSFEDFKAKKQAKEQKTKRVRLYRMTLSIAASLILLFVAFTLVYRQYFDITEYQTLAGQQRLFTFPDGSTVNMNGNSLLSFKNSNWEENRKVNFEGQGFFSVEKKGSFELQLPNAKIQVVGTKFDVLAQPEAMNIKCFEGEVIVAYKNEEKRLKKGQGFRASAETSPEEFELQEDGEQPSWMDEAYTKFKKAPLQEVLDAMSMKYGFQFENVLGTHQATRYSGQFTHNDGDKALKMVLGALKISYEKEGKRIILK